MTTKSNKRKNTRFVPEQGTLAEIDFNLDKPGFHASCRGLVITESHGGCSAVIVWGPSIRTKDKCKIAVGKLAPLIAEVRWVIPLDESIQKIGFQYLE